jgi:RNA polymerase sigma factor for flagellar operon FliA
LDFRQLLVDHLDLIRKIVRFVAHRRHFSRSDAEEFASFVHLKLIDRDFAILRKFEGRSTLKTYLTIVVERLSLDFCIAKWGKWRPSANARRLGPVAMLLEQLICREGITFDEAVGTLQTNHGVAHTRAELHGLLLQLPGVQGGRAGGTEPVGPASPPATAPTFADIVDDRRAIERVRAALADAIAHLEDEDRELLALRFERDLSMVEISRLTGRPLRSLYRRLDQVTQALRLELLKRGVSGSEIGAVIGHPMLALADVLVENPRR